MGLVERYEYMYNIITLVCFVKQLYSYILQH